MNIYKIYDIENNALIFTSITAISNFLDLSNDDVSIIFSRGVHTVAFGVVVITY